MKNRTNQIDIKNYYNICKNKELILKEKIEYDNKLLFQFLFLQLIREKL